MPNAPAADEITRDHLAPAVAHQLGRGRITILDFTVEPIKGGIGNPVSLGLFRISYEASVDDQRSAGTMILKVIQSPANLGLVGIGGEEDRSHWNYWRREPFFYQSGLVHSLPAGLVAPTCYGSIFWDNDIAWLWLEDLGPSQTAERPLGELVDISRSLGRLNGHFTGPDRLPDYDWFSQNQLAQMVSRIPGPFQNPLFAGIGRPRWDHPFLARLFPAATGEFRQFMARIDDILAVLEQLPLCWCHGDGNPNNFVVRPGPNGNRETVAMDWALTGMGNLGKDAAQLVGGSLELFEPGQQELSIETIFEAYCQGLAESGWSGRQEQVRFGFSAAAAIDYGLFFIFFLGLGLAGDEDHVPAALTITDQQRASVAFINDVSRQALELLAAGGGN